MAIVGGALFPPIMGLISDHLKSLALAYAVPLAAYIFVAYYSFLGSHVRPVSELSATK
jgi:FHS family L-fucose permease-like MFS transporter